MTAKNILSYAMRHGRIDMIKTFIKKYKYDSKKLRKVFLKHINFINRDIYELFVRHGMIIHSYDLYGFIDDISANPDNKFLNEITSKYRNDSYFLAICIRVSIWEGRPDYIKIYQRWITPDVLVKLASMIHLKNFTNEMYDILDRLSKISIWQDAILLPTIRNGEPFYLRYYLSRGFEFKNKYYKIIYPKHYMIGCLIDYGINMSGGDFILLNNAFKHGENTTICLFLTQFGVRRIRDILDAGFKKHWKCYRFGRDNKFSLWFIKYLIMNGYYNRLFDNDIITCINEFKDHTESFLRGIHPSIDNSINAALRGFISTSNKGFIDVIVKCTD